MWLVVFFLLSWSDFCGELFYVSYREFIYKETWQVHKNCFEVVDKQADRQTVRQTNSQTDKQSDRQTVRQTNSQTDKQSDRQTVRQTNSQTG